MPNILFQRKYLVSLLAGVIAIGVVFSLKIIVKDHRPDSKLSGEKFLDKNEAITKNSIPEINKVVLVSIDTLRWDHLGFNGYPINTSPFIDELSRKSINFKNAFSHSSVTPAADASLFTSLYPLQHGLHNFDTKSPKDSYVMLAEILKDKGFYTGAFTSLDHASLGNVFQGFDVADIAEHTRPANETLQHALDWVEEKQKEDNIFLWTHLDDPHDMFAYKEEYYEQIQKMANQVGRDQLLDNLLNVQNINMDCIVGLPDRKIHTFDKEEILNKILAYDAKIRFVDDELKKFFNAMKDRGFGDKTLWIITSEHGEGLCNHGHFYHGGRINNEQLHVPLLLYFPSLDFAYATEKIVEHVDVAPTVAGLAGVSFEKQIKPIQGTSLLTFLDGDNNLFPDKYAFSHRLHMLEDTEGFHEMRIGDFKYILNKDGSEQFLDVSVSPPKNIINDQEYSHYKNILKKEVDSQYEKFSLQDRKYKYILRKKGGDELYDITNDPYELKNIIDNDSMNAIKGVFKSEILDRVSLFSQGSSSEEGPLTKDLMDKLESAGYIK